jgi:hypothetical protein
MYPPRRRQVPGVVSLGLTLILLGVLLAIVSLARLQTASADGHRPDAAPTGLHLPVPSSPAPPTLVDPP